VLLAAEVKLAFLALVVALATAAHADNRKHVAILEFDGPRAANVRGDVMRLVAGKSWVSSSSKLDGRTVREFALDHDVEIVVLGTVEKRRREYHVRIRFLRGATGDTVIRTSVTVRQPALDRQARRRVERDLVRALAAVPARPDDDVAVDTAPREAP
jgi:hypothetical protein